MSSKSNYRGSTRFIEVGSPNSSFRSLLNVEHVSNVRFEQDIQQIDAQYDEDGEMTAPPQQMLLGWVIVIHFGDTGQKIAFADEEQAVECYNMILDMISDVGVPMRKQKKLEAQTDSDQISFLDADGNAINDELPGEVPELTEEELDALANPEFDIDAIADAVEAGLGASDDDDIK